jgi:hypothetical protein
MDTLTPRTEELSGRMRGLLCEERVCQEALGDVENLSDW